MSAIELMRELQIAGVQLRRDDEGRLKYRDPGRVLTPERLEAMRAHKAELMALVDQQSITKPLVVDVRLPGGSTWQAEFPPGTAVTQAVEKLATDHWAETATVDGKQVRLPTVLNYEVDGKLGTYIDHEGTAQDGVRVLQQTYPQQGRLGRIWHRGEQVYS